ncbi:MAG TPA: LysR family transcriptional regulator [Gemmatimonadales bacterium]|jgi:DNA-binding transcriptional LysR family regulator
MAEELDGMATFVAVADAKGFRAAGDRLGVTHSAVSQAVRRLEARLGVALLRRSTRSIHLTDAGVRLYEALRPALHNVRAAVAEVREKGDEPRGLLRLHSSRAAETMFGESLLSGFLRAYPQIQLDLVVSDVPVDIVADGYDAGIQLGEVIDKDMVAVRVTGELRLVVVGSPSYFARHGVPRHPRDLIQHECLNWHPTAAAPPYRWEFTENGREFSVAVSPRVLSTDAALNRRLVTAGIGITMAYKAHVRDALARGDLVAVLEKFCPPFPGYFLYYPQYRQASRVLRALIEHIRFWRRSK